MRNSLFSSSLLLFGGGGILLFLLTQCQSFEDDLVPELQIQNATSLAPARIVYRGGTDQSKNDTPKMTFGPEKVNPYNIDRMTQAWNNLYSQSVLKLPVTHRYVQFNPAGPQELADLEDEDFELVHFPLHFEIITFGEYDPAVPPGKIPPLYAIVPIGNAIASTFNHEILEEYLLAPYQSFLTAEAFRLAGQDHAGIYTGVNANVVGGGTYGGDPPQEGGGDCDPDCPSFPCCYSIEVDCDDDLPLGDCFLFDIPCAPTDPEFPHCLDIEATGSPDPNHTPTLNECGCQVTYDERRPAGCVQVVDTNLPVNTTIGGSPLHLRGVRNVKVRWWDGWIDFSTSETDENGCFQFNEREYGKAWMWVKFKSDRVTVRGLRGARFWEYGMAVEDVAHFGSPPYNDLRIIYDQAADDGSKDKSYWYAATANNALYEFDDMATDDGIALPDQDLEITIANYEGTAAAPMLNQIFQDPDIAIGTYVTATTFLNLLQIDQVVPQLNTLLLYTQIYAPDIWYNYGVDESISSGLPPTDGVKDVFYHEYAHAAHYRALGPPPIANSYWLSNISYILANAISNNNPPYGDGTTPGAGRTAIMETWGNHIGSDYADRFYGLDHSWTTSGNPITREERRWIYRLEEWDPMAVLGAPNYSDSTDTWIPEGVFRDCIDNNSLNPSGVNEPVTDDVTGYNNAVILTAMVRTLAQPITVEALRDLLISDYLPPAETAANVNTLFGDYGY